MPLHRRRGLVERTGIPRLGSGLALERPVAPHQRDPPRASELMDAVMADLLDKGLDLLFLPGDLNHQLIGADVEDATPENLYQGIDLGSKCGGAWTLINIRSRST